MGRQETQHNGINVA